LKIRNLASLGDYVIQTDVVPIGDVFQSNILEGGLESGVFEIPPIQRQYQWGIGDKKNEKKNRSAKELIDDLLNFHKFNSDNDLPYFVGTIIVYQDASSRHGCFQLMDGQQRWTTYTALMGVIYSLFDGDQTGEDWGEVKNDIRTRFLRSDEEDFRLQSHRDYDDALIHLLSNMDAGTDLESWVSDSEEAPVNEFMPENTRFTGTNLYCVARFFQQYLSERFAITGPLSSRKELSDFYTTIKQRIIVNLTLAPSSSVAYEMFITANARGTPLNNFDILRGLIITREMELDLGIAEEVRGLLQKTQKKLDSLVKAKPKSDESTIIDGIISEICSVKAGQRVEKTTVMHYLKEQMSEITTQQQLRDYCRFVLRYTWMAKHLEDRQYLEAPWEYVRMDYIGFVGHLPIYITSLIASTWGGAPIGLVHRLMAGIESLVMRNALTQSRQATLYFYANTPKIAHRIYQNGLSEALVNDLLGEFSCNTANPDDLGVLGEDTRNWDMPASMKERKLISAFYALEELTGGPYGSGQYSRDTRLVVSLMPRLDFEDFSRLNESWEYGHEAQGQNRISRTIGNIFLLRGPATAIKEEDEENHYNPERRIIDFRARSASMTLSADSFLERTNWTNVHIQDRTQKLVQLFEERFPHDCDPRRPA
jgi:hypothetical protein